MTINVPYKRDPNTSLRAEATIMPYTHQELLAIQIEHEQEMLDKGITKYRKSVADAGQRAEESGTHYGNLLMKQSIDKMVNALCCWC